LLLVVRGFENRYPQIVRVEISEQKVKESILLSALTFSLLLMIFMAQLAYCMAGPKVKHTDVSRFPHKFGWAVSRMTGTTKP